MMSLFLWIHDIVAKVKVFRHLRINYFNTSHKGNSI